MLALSLDTKAFGVSATGYVGRGPLLRARQRFLSSNSALDIEDIGRQRDLVTSHLAYPESIQKIGSVVAVGREEHAYRAHAAKALPRVGVGVAHHDREVGFFELIEGEQAFAQDLAQLTVVLLAGALLLGLTRIAVEQMR